jgi:alpha-galactosidase
MSLKITMLGAGSGFVVTIARELIEHKLFNDSEFCLMDVADDKLETARQYVQGILDQTNNNIKLTIATSQAESLEGADYVISSCEEKRYSNWVKDLRIPAAHGVHQVTGENGGPGGMIHAVRNCCMYKNIIADMEKYCPDAWLMNFTNPMSILCTYFKNYSSLKALGFCHQVHGSFGVIAEMLGMEPGELEVVSAGNNHLNWLFDIRLKNTGKSYMKEFLEQVRESKYWKQHFPNIPQQNFTLEVLNTFGMYPVGYDNHIIEYFPCFWEEYEWAEYGFKSLADKYEMVANEGLQTLKMQTLLGREYEKPPFPVDNMHPYYAEKPCQVILALETNTPTYLDAINITNNGAITNLPANVILDVPAVVVGGDVRSIHVGELPSGPHEICRRQIALHEMIAQAAHEGSDSLAIQALSLDPYVRSITQAKNIWKDFRKEYKEYLTAFE